MSVQVHRVRGEEEVLDNEAHRWLVAKIVHQRQWVGGGEGKLRGGGTREEGVIEVGTEGAAVCEEEDSAGSIGLEVEVDVLGESRNGGRGFGYERCGNIDGSLHFCQIEEHISAP